MTMHVHTKTTETHRIALPRRLVGRRIPMGQTVYHITGDHLGTVVDHAITAMGRGLYTVETPDGRLRSFLGTHLKTRASVTLAA